MNPIPEDSELKIFKSAEQGLKLTVCHIGGSGESKQSYKELTIGFWEGCPVEISKREFACLPPLPLPAPERCGVICMQKQCHIVFGYQWPRFISIP